MLEALLAIPFVLALVVGLLGRNQRRTAAWLAAAAPVAGLVLLALLTHGVLHEGGVRSTTPWVPSLGLALSLRLDGLAWMFAGLVLAIGLLIVVYARYYLSEEDSMPRFFSYLLLFMGSMLGMVVAGNLILLAVFWELTSVSSFLLIGFWNHRSDARDGARMALAITGAGGLALLGGVILLGRITGSYELDVVLASGPQILASPLYPAALVLVLLAVFTKSAQFPFQFWLPHAMAAPTPVSAYLHSATMVKAGVFLLARLHPALAGSDLFFYLVSGIGAITLLVGSWHAIFQHDVKGLLAYSTISHLGLITLLFGLSTPMAVVAGLFHIINHATFKASLFMAAGIIDHETGTRDMRRLGGLFKLMPYTGTLAIIASLAMAGVPLLNGFLSKEMFFTEALEVEGHTFMRWAIAGAAVAAGAFGVAYSLRFVHDTFFGEGPARVEGAPHEPPRFMRIPVEVLVVVCLAVGMAPAITIAPVLHAAATGVLGEGNVPYYSLAIWHGWNTPLMMSLFGLAAGIALYFGITRLINLYGISYDSLGRRVYEWKLASVTRKADRLTQTLGNGSLQRYLLLMVLAALVMGAAPFIHLSLSPGPAQPMPPLGWLVWAIGVGATLATVALHRHRLVALVVMGAVGLAVSLGFALLSAPDLALTQLLVEMVTIALILLALNYLPDESAPEPSSARRWRDAVISLAAGGGVAALVYSVITRPLDTVASEMLALSVPEGGGGNVVNVILVDFRGFDTLGEIAVFGIAGLVVHAMLRRARMLPEARIGGDRDSLLIPNLVVRLLLPLALAVSLYLFLRGHNLPGGGFIAGLVIAVPMLLQYVLSGASYVEQRLGFDYPRLIGLGLLAALLTGLGSWLLGYPYMTSHTDYLAVPLLGKLPMASAMAFDIGVYLVVAASTLLMLAMMGTVKRPLDGRRG
ncbi:MAG: monovalent cation/H+ antiporter subunit A [Arenimonas sp.]|uniref:monovalent cation/H+ antiporter subunit A n=1 Tax=Arenimonas sp. TaxID=1872635 RepID=UPI0025C709B6|nr:monovalent cation/H+ antiporter subunit A [Arenimonas sp.]MBW8367136.1 monovalent cation/H+ antiporter subunit A [Arenimonas sp.]